MAGINGNGCLGPRPVLRKKTNPGRPNSWYLPHKVGRATVEAAVHYKGSLSGSHTSVSARQSENSRLEVGFARGLFREYGAAIDGDRKNQSILVCLIRGCPQ